MRWGSVVLVAGLALCGAVRAAVPDFAGAPPKPATPGQATAVFAGGCFWGVDAVYKHLKGVKKVVSGYSGGSAATARYEMVGSGMTGHAESVEVTYDPSQIAYTDLLKVFFAVAHDPTELNRQGNDIGTQYRSAIFPQNDEQERAAHEALARANEEHGGRVVTTIEPMGEWYPAEDYHQDYWANEGQRNPYCIAHIPPKLQKLRKSFQARAKSAAATA